MKRLPGTLSVQAFNIAWSRSRDANPRTAGAPGVDWIEAPIFSSNLATHIASLRTSIRNGSFSFSPLRLVQVIKPSGDFRNLAIPTVRDRLLQRTLLGHMEQDKKFPRPSSISYGFHKGRTLADAQRRALELRQSRHWVLQADIVRFFDMIPRDHLQKLIRRRVGTKIVADLLCAATDCEIEASKSARQRLRDTSGIKRGLGLRQGMPVSPALSNFLLKDFDDGLLAGGFVAIRYADDIAVFCQSEQECRSALEVIRKGLASLSLKVPDLADDGKTQIRSPSEPALFLGVEIARFPEGYQLRAPTKKLKQIEERMAELTSLDLCVKERRNLGQVVRSLEAVVVGHVASMAILDDGGDFAARLTAAKTRAMKRLLGEILGPKAVAALTDQQLAVLGVRSFT
ncbi:MAG: reverse transcriptase domain-containing protein [Caulobacter sp.]